MSTAPVPKLSEEDYLRLERASLDQKHEFYRGEMFAMAGATRAHNLIVGNLTAWFVDALRDGPCETYPADMRVLVDRTGLYTYPDLTIACDKPEFRDGELDTLLNPRMLIEVLSKSTETYDRGKKFHHYQQIPSLREYLLVGQEEPRIERYLRIDESRWTLDSAEGLEGAIPIEAVGTQLPLAEVYRRIDFSAQPESQV